MNSRHLPRSSVISWNNQGRLYGIVSHFFHVASVKWNGLGHLGLLCKTPVIKIDKIIHISVHLFCIFNMFSMFLHIQTELGGWWRTRTFGLKPTRSRSFPWALSIRHIQQVDSSQRQSNKRSSEKSGASERIHFLGRLNKTWWFTFWQIRDECPPIRNEWHT